MAKPLTLNIMMLGGRRVGKTSVLAAMNACFGEVFRGTELTLVPEGKELLMDLEKKYHEIEDYVNKASKNVNFTPDANPSLGDVTYCFSLNLGAQNVINLEFYDFPGEWMVTWNSGYDTIEQKIQESDVLMIVIDTPYLMEDDGTYNDARNRCFRITSAVISKFSFEKNLPKMVLFVPVKCEKYFYEGRMDEVYSKIDGPQCYRNLISYLKGKCEIAVTPILTMGTTSFKLFDYDKATGEFHMRKEADGSELPSTPLYSFIADKAKAAAERQGLDRKYAVDPQFCEQPAVYSLVYALTYAEQAANIKAENSKKVPFKKMAKILIPVLQATIRSPLWKILPDDTIENLIEHLLERFDFVSANEFLKQRKLLEQKMKKTGDGYYIIQPDVLDFL